MWVTIITALIPVALWVIEQFFLSDKDSKESRELYLKLTSFFRVRGVKLAKTRFEAIIEQSEAGNLEWDKREAPKGPSL